MPNGKRSRPIPILGKTKRASQVPTSTQRGLNTKKSLMSKMKSWKKELWEALTSVDKHVTKKAEVIVHL